MKTKQIIFLTSVLSVISTNVFSRVIQYKYPAIYPFVPIEAEKIREDVKRVSEDENYIINFKEALKHSKGKTKNKPWTSTFWPLNKGLIADPYSDSFFGAYLPLRVFSWEHNKNRYEDRINRVHKKIDELSNDELDKLAPSEKYDLLLGDKSFHLTNKLWEYAINWGEKKKYGGLTNLNIVGGNSADYAKQILDWGWYDNFDEAFSFALKKRGGLAEHLAQQVTKSDDAHTLISAIEQSIPRAEQLKNNYVLENVDDSIATWEGICHGWSTAAGIIPRPRRTVSFKLDDGRTLKFYPEDIKGLISLLWANSLVQDGKWIDVNTGKNIGGGVIMQGLRCNERTPKKDIWGRYYDTIPNADTKELQPRCVGVHPAVWHLGLVNIIGKQKRSFIVERKIKAAVDNHPLYSYKMKYFNPNTGKYDKDSMKNNIVKIDSNDQFKQFRHPKAKYVVGVQTVMTYLDWERPRRKETDSESDDSEHNVTMLYDLEIDAKGNIVGGQWRTTEVGAAVRPGDEAYLSHTERYQYRRSSQRRAMHRQPDFFWVVTKDWKPFFKANTEISTWKDTSRTPPSDWLEAAKGAHDFIYYKTHNYGFNEKCKMVNKNDKDDVIEVPCEFQDSRPQPLINVVDELIKRSK